MIEITKMEDEHLNRVVEIEKNTFSVPWSKKAFEESMSLDNTEYYVALESGNVVGYCGLYKIMSEGDITNVAVSADNRRQGIGRKLIEELVGCALENDINRIMLEVRESNESAIALYETTGFCKITKRKDYYKHPKEDAIVMLKKL